MEFSRYPIPAEMHAIEQAARLARARTIAGCFIAAARGLKALAARGASAFAAATPRPEASPERRAGCNVARGAS
ncbi:MAG TPA: hypothetical protein VMN03_01115 [Burkholderiales bacterium]|nr:hypothetical protein [Burkholderiales bacterium]